MRPVYTFPDPQLETRDALRSLLARRSEACARGVVVSTRDLVGADGARDLPHVKVYAISASRDARLNGRATVRCAITHADVGQAIALGNLAEAVLLAAHPARIRFLPNIGTVAVEGGDDAGLPLASFTINARTRPQDTE